MRRLIQPCGGIVGQSLLDFLVRRWIGDDVLHLLGVVDVVEVTELGAEKLLGVELSKNTSGFGRNVIDGEMVA